MHQRASRMILSQGLVHLRCDEPVLVQVREHFLAVTLGCSDWSRAHPLADPARAVAALTSEGAPASAPEIELVTPSALRVDRAHILVRLCRKSLILTHAACQERGAAKAAAARAGAALDRGDAPAAGQAMAECLGHLSGAAGLSPGVRDYARRTGAHLAHLLGDRPAPAPEPPRP